MTSRRDDDDAPPPRDPGPLFRPPAPHSGSLTSRAAAAAVDHQERLGRLAAFAAERGTHGATDEEAQEALRVPGNTLRPLRWRALEVGVVVLTPRTRPTRAGRAAGVWVLADHATEEELAFTRRYLEGQRERNRNRARSVELLRAYLSTLADDINRRADLRPLSVLGLVRQKMDELGLTGEPEEPRERFP